ncbi:unnamed protein product [Diatraea saccharalis]|uniref:Uncharacterized protein n=1 Tax=Diatraea saccharalis TaxID=40085 RepID=A0A9N9RAQ3_9NEOP|nr:unnamed protein product [Diatraea saccharalis]
MIRTVLVLTVLYAKSLVRGSVEHDGGFINVYSAQGVPVPVPPPVVTSASSQYFERTFNRLVVPQTAVPVAPVHPVVSVAPAAPVIPVAPAPSVFVQPTANLPVTPVQNNPIQPNIAIAVATAQAAPVATFLLPPYPFAPPPTSVGFVPAQPGNVPDDSRKETTTPTTKQTEVETTTKQIETTTPLATSNSDNSFVQALPSNQNTNFNIYGPPRPQWPQQHTPQQQTPQKQWYQPQRPLQKPLKLKTSVEIVPVPLAYIAPPPLPKFQHIRTVKHIHTFVPTKAKLIIRPVHVVSSPVKVRSVRVPAKLVYRLPITARGGPGRPMKKEVEPLTFRPSMIPVTKPPRL